MGNNRLLRLALLLIFIASSACGAGTNWRGALGTTVTALDLFCGSYGAIRPAIAPLATPDAGPPPSALPSGALLFVPLDALDAGAIVSPARLAVGAASR